MTNMIRAVVFSRGSPHLLRLLRWCHDQRIPLVICEVCVGAAFEPTAFSMVGSRVERERWEPIVEARRRMSSSNGFYKNDINGERKMATGVLIRETDFDLAKLYHGGMMRRGWMWYLDQAVYGDEGRPERVYNKG